MHTLVAPRLTPAGWWLAGIKESSRTVRVISCLLALGFATAHRVGYWIETFGSLYRETSLSLVLLVAEILLTALILGAIILPITHWASQHPGLRSSSPRGIWALPRGRRVLTIIGLLAAVWLVYWVFLWPGVVSTDTYEQLKQALGAVPFSDHHPLAHTLLLKGLLTAATWITGSTNSALGLVSLAQLFALAAVFALYFETLRGLRLPQWVLNTNLVLFALHPLIGWFSVTLWKDMWLAAFVLLLASSTAVIVRRRGEVNWKWWALFFAAALGMMLAKKTGVYLALPFILLTALFLRGRALVTWLLLGLAAVGLYFGAHSALMSTLEATPSPKAEALSIPVQQIARTVLFHGPELSAAEHAEIHRFFPVPDLGALYNPEISDKVKQELDPDAYDEHSGDFWQLWAQLAKQYPRTYLESILAGTSGYWYPHTQHWMVQATDWTAMVNSPPNNRGLTELVDPQLASDRQGPTAVKAAAQSALNVNLRTIPVFGLLFALGAWVWVAVWYTAVGFLRRRRPTFPAALLAALVLGTCLISPVFAEARYAYPILLLLPLLGITAFERRESQVGQPHGLPPSP